MFDRLVSGVYLLQPGNIPTPTDNDSSESGTETPPEPQITTLSSGLLQIALTFLTPVTWVTVEGWVYYLLLLLGRRRLKSKHSPRRLGGPHAARTTQYFLSLLPVSASYDSFGGIRRRSLAPDTESQYLPFIFSALHNCIIGGSSPLNLTATMSMNIL